MPTSNAAIVRKAYADFAHGDVPSVLAVFDPAITWHVPGSGPLSGDFTGHEEVVAFFERTMQLSGGVFTIDVHRVLADDDVVVALVTVRAQRNGRSGTFPEVHVWGVAGGKIRSFREYQGAEQAEDRFWSD